MRGAVVRKIVDRLQPRRRAITIERAPAQPGLGPQSVDSVSIVQDGVPNSGPTSTVELVTNSVADTLAGDACPGVAPGGKAFSGNVSLNQFFPRPLSNAFVQVTSISDDDHQPFAGHQAINSDASELGLDNTLGLWKYTATFQQANYGAGKSHTLTPVP